MRELSRNSFNHSEVRRIVSSQTHYGCSFAAPEITLFEIVAVFKSKLIPSS